MISFGNLGRTLAGLAIPTKSQPPDWRADSMPSRVRNPPETIRTTLGKLVRMVSANERKKDSRWRVLSLISLDGGPVVVDCDNSGCATMRGFS